MTSFRLPALLALTLALTACGAHPGAVNAARGAAVIKDVPGVLQARAVAGAPAEVIAATDTDAPLSAPNAHETDRFTFRGQTYHLMSVGSASLLQTVVGALRGTNGVRMADSNVTVSALDAQEPDDEFYEMQYGLIQKKLPDAWQITMGDPNLTVGVIDTGVDFTNVEFRDRVVKGPNFLFRPGWLLHRTDKVGPMDDNAHGTHCAGIIGASANNGAYPKAGSGAFSTMWQTKRPDDFNISPWGGQTGGPQGFDELKTPIVGKGSSEASANVIKSLPELAVSGRAGDMIYGSVTGGWAAIVESSTGRPVPVRSYFVSIYGKDGTPLWSVVGGK